ncbi:MAG TPA: hypothetical protein VNH15_07485 [Elusimicrobiota bacterium]|nr:hypothetical protein [Elusimicrobiota bacterium]
MNGGIRVLLAAALVAAAVTWRLRKKSSPAQSLPQARLCFGDDSSDVPPNVPVPLSTGFLLNGATKQQIYDLRRHAVSLYPQLIGAGYEPSKKVFGGIVDGRPWWGLDGIYGYGEGPQSISGFSQQGSIIANPLLLIGLISPLVWTFSGRWANYWTITSVAAAPTPHNLMWDCQSSAASVIYDVSKYLNLTANDPDQWTHVLWMEAYNARDLGFNYLYLDPTRSKNVKKLGDTHYSEKIVDHAEASDNCGYPSGCNDMDSGGGYGMGLRVTALPAVAVFKLWKGEQRPDASSQADATFTIDLR